MSKEKEEWRPVVGYEGLYEVSDCGRVKQNESYRMFGNHMCHFKGKLKNLRKRGNYYIVNLAKDGIPKTYKVSRLVAMAFVPNPENKPIVDHIIPVKNGGTDVAWNLRLATHKENSNNPITKENMILGQKNNTHIYERDELGRFKKQTLGGSPTSQ